MHDMPKYLLTPNYTYVTTVPHDVRRIPVTEVEICLCDACVKENTYIHSVDSLLLLNPFGFLCFREMQYIGP